MFLAPKTSISQRNVLKQEPARIPDEEGDVAMKIEQILKNTEEPVSAVTASDSTGQSTHTESSARPFKCLLIGFFITLLAPLTFIGLIILLANIRSLK